MDEHGSRSGQGDESERVLMQLTIRSDARMEPTIWASM